MKILNLVVSSFAALAVLFVFGVFAESMDMKHDHAKMEKKEAAVEKAKVVKEIWACPMGDYRGEKTKDDKCPKCGMKLSKELIVRELTKAELGKNYVCPVTKESFKGSAENKAIEYKGKTYYMCCDDCPEQFINSPGKFIKTEKNQEEKEKSSEKTCH